MTRRRAGSSDHAAYRLAAAAVLACAAMLGAAPQSPGAAVVARLDRAAQKWVDRTLKTMTLDQKVGQTLMSSFDALYFSSDSEEFDRLSTAVRDYHVGGFVVFGGRSQPAPGVLLNPAYSAVTLGQPFSVASTLNRLQRLATIPLLNAGDFENGPGFRLAGATTFPRMMAFGAVGDERLVRDAAAITAREARALGVHVNLAPVADVNNNPRNPVINTRSFGASPAAVAGLVTAYVQGVRDGHALSTLKHFPGHGDTEVDSHIGFPLIRHARGRLDQVELPPFRAGISAGSDAVMTAHVTLPELDADVPATLSPVVPRLLRDELGHTGLIFTDSMTMSGVTKLADPGAAAVRAFNAGHDMVLESPDDGAAFRALRMAVETGEISRERLDASVRRVLTAKARLGLHKERLVSLDALQAVVGTRAHARIADEGSRRAITLIRDAAGHVPLAVSRDASILYLSVLDYPAGWGIAAPSRTFTPELRKRWPNVTAVEVSDRTPAGELDLVRASAARYDAIVASVFVRASSGSGRIDLGPTVVRLLQDMGRGSAARAQPFVATFFGNPYVTMHLPDVPAMLLTYDLYDRAEASAVRALAGEAPITGKLPIPIPGVAEIGYGLERPARVTSQR